MGLWFLLKKTCLTSANPTQWDRWDTSNKSREDIIARQQNTGADFAAASNDSNQFQWHEQWWHVSSVWMFDARCLPKIPHQLHDGLYFPAFFNPLLVRWEQPAWRSFCNTYTPSRKKALKQLAVHFHMFQSGTSFLMIFVSFFSVLEYGGEQTCCLFRLYPRWKRETSNSTTQPLLVATSRNFSRTILRLGRCRGAGSGGKPNCRCFAIARSITSTVKCFFGWFPRNHCWLLAVGWHSLNVEVPTAKRSNAEDCKFPCSSGQPRGVCEAVDGEGLGQTFHTWEEFNTTAS